MWVDAARHRSLDLESVRLGTNIIYASKPENIQ